MGKCERRRKAKIQIPRDRKGIVFSMGISGNVLSTVSTHYLLQFKLLEW